MNDLSPDDLNLLIGIVEASLTGLTESRWRSPWPPTEDGGRRADLDAAIAQRERILRVLQAAQVPENAQQPKGDEPIPI